ncbi:methylenetetrahydrofolate--tRNA-(uracil(54)-C(5))-methyltransferase (FADH(2)-oxidizing) TrmFO, partial [bacterium]|nr:methylenetetrahydrofolate--tRNA-(uracil(54)-C(5))-methyltransferase (FADH(2)-oxidizing) TrmFO [bacterium]
PLASDRLAARLADMTGHDRLFFYDAIAPVIDAASIDHDRAFFASRWTTDDSDYLNCPMDKEEYEAFVNALLEADRVQARSFEDARFFDACLPVEVMALRGIESLRYGPMRPVGIVDPGNGQSPYAVVQLRKETLKGDAYNMVGFQTRLTYPEQKRVFSLIPALSKAVYLRHGSIHRNTFLNSPEVLLGDLSMKNFPDTYLAGQITGVEGYMESASTGILAGISLHARISGRDFSPPPADTAMGALIQHITEPAKDFQPTNINFGIMQDPGGPKKYRKQLRLEKERSSFDSWMKSLSDLISTMR